MLRLCVTPRALGGGSQPSGADFHRIGVVGSLKGGSGRPTPSLNIQIARGAYNPIVPHDGERHAAASLTISQRRLDVVLRLLDTVRNAGVGKLLPGL